MTIYSWFCIPVEPHTCMRIIANSVLVCVRVRFVCKAKRTRFCWSKRMVHDYGACKVRCTYSFWRLLRELVCLFLLRTRTDLCRYNHGFWQREEERERGAGEWKREEGEKVKERFGREKKRERRARKGTKELFMAR